MLLYAISFDMGPLPRACYVLCSLGGANCAGMVPGFLTRRGFHWLSRKQQWAEVSRHWTSIGKVKEQEAIMPMHFTG